MCNHQFLSQPSWDLGEYLTNVDYEEILFYQSPERLIQSINMNLPSSAHRMESPLFDPMTDDMNAVSTLPYDDQLFINSDNYEFDDTDSFPWGESTVVPHPPNILTGIAPNISVPLSPLPKDMHKNSQSNIAPSLTPHPLAMKKIRIFDHTIGRERRPLLHEFIRFILENDEYAHVAQYVDRKQGIFKLYDPKLVAELWKHVKGRNSDNKMTYDKLARALRYYYRNGIMHSSRGRYTFRFGSKSGFGSTWWPAYQ